jgi:hypothetical protein
MAITQRMRTVRRVTGAATSTAPYVRRLATDEELRADMTDFVRSANDLVREVATDHKVRRDAREMILSLQDGVGRVRSDIRPRRRSRSVMAFGAGVLFAAFAVAAALAYPRSRRRIASFAGETRERASSTVNDARERASARVHDVRERFGKAIPGIERERQAA